MATDEHEGTAPDLVTVDLLRELLSAEDAQACLVLEGGRVRIAEDGRNGMVVATRADVVQRLGRNPDPTALTEQAALLDSEVRLLGA
ncbi:hypothetical protein [Nocardia caishijiensis]|uniref:Uncharacterized protein n=1 Tax=Nocardia caishijiensis TaxID=184756 RepID=A0ABQ6YHZ4_9NOCA|nr:hypothetical protein [Nocardia caishijiensis]KAF0845379.1 hypothetical protein FNL39_108187 [Nocardia caishijiensis]